MTQDTIQEIEQNIRECKEIVELNVMLERLKANRDFKKLILEGYFRDEAVRLVHLKADPAMQTPQRQAAITLQIDAIGAVSSYLHTVAYNAQLATKGIEAGELARDEILAGDNE